jgi:hypothetical protein
MEWLIMCPNVPVANYVNGVTIGLPRSARRFASMLQQPECRHHGTLLRHKERVSFVGNSKDLHIDVKKLLKGVSDIEEQGVKV